MAEIAAVGSLSFEDRKGSGWSLQSTYQSPAPGISSTTIPTLHASTHGTLESHLMDKASSSSDKPEDDHKSADHVMRVMDLQDDILVYRVYKRRWLGVIGLFLLNVSAGMNWLWFSPIATDVSSQFDMSLTRVNWLQNAVNLIYLPVSFLVPPLCARYGIRLCCTVAAGCLLISGWIRYAGTPHSLSPNASFTVLLVAQIFTGFAQPWFQVLGPKYSELWFDLNGRTTATAIMAIANPIGSALGELISPLISDVRESVLVLAIITTVLSASCCLILGQPPSPPTFAGSNPSPPLMQILRATIGRPRPGEHQMEFRERSDFIIVSILFGVLVGAADAFFILVNQIFEPHGYSTDASGNMGGALIVAGIIGGLVTAPIFDRVLTRHLGLVAKILVPILAAGWVSLIWDVRPHNYGGLYPVFIIIGVGSFVLLPVALEVGCEVTKSPESSSAVLWCVANLFSVIFVLVMDALRDGPQSTPPRDMKKGLIFLGVIVAVSSVTVGGLRAKQSRRELDHAKHEEATVTLGTRRDIEG